MGSNRFTPASLICNRVALRYLGDIQWQGIAQEIAMTDRNTKIQIAFRYRTADSPSGVTRKTAKRLAEQLGVDETQVIHRALRDHAAKVLPPYERDEGPLSAAQVRQIKKQVPQGTKRSVRSTLFDSESVRK
ncbi:MAG: hypothetical protein ACM36C_06310 [Acidobacteriota bacterium]